MTDAESFDFWTSSWSREHITTCPITYTIFFIYRLVSGPLVFTNSKWVSESMYTLVIDYWSRRPRTSRLVSGPPLGGRGNISLRCHICQKEEVQKPKDSSSVVETDSTRLNTWRVPRRPSVRIKCGTYCLSEDVKITVFVGRIVYSLWAMLWFRVTETETMMEISLIYTIGSGCGVRFTRQYSIIG